MTAILNPLVASFNDWCLCMILREVLTAGQHNLRPKRRELLNSDSWVVVQ